MTGTTDIQIVRNLDSIVPEWQDLFDHCSNATPFQSPAWLRPWWRQFGQGDPFAVVVRKHNRFAGLGLFYIYEGDPFRRAQLFFLGKSVSDYLDILVADGENASTVAQQIFDYLFESAHDWHHADLDRLRSNSAVLSVRPHLQISEKRVQEGVCPEVHLAGPRIRQITTKNTRNAIRKHMNHACAMGKVDFVTADRANYFRLLQNLIEFHSARWRSSGHSGVFSDVKMVRFLTDAAAQLVQHQMLRLQAMQLDGVPVAVSFGILHRKRHYFYLCDFNSQYSSFSPGTLLTSYAMEQAAKHGAQYFDFLQGEEEYKYKKWGAQPRPTWRIQYLRDLTAVSNDKAAQVL